MYKRQAEEAGRSGRLEADLAAKAIELAKEREVRNRAVAEASDLRARASALEASAAQARALETRVAGRVATLEAQLDAARKDLMAQVCKLACCGHMHGHPTDCYLEVVAAF